MKIECTEREMEYLIEMMAGACRGQFDEGPTCDYYDTCENCIKDKIQWVIIDEKLEVDIDSTTLSDNTKKILINGGYSTLRDIVDTRITKLICVRGFGRKNLLEVIEFMKSVGYVEGNGFFKKENQT